MVTAPTENVAQFTDEELEDLKANLEDRKHLARAQ